MPVLHVLLIHVPIHVSLVHCHLRYRKVSNTGLVQTKENLLEEILQSTYSAIVCLIESVPCSTSGMHSRTKLDD